MRRDRRTDRRTDRGTDRKSQLRSDRWLRWIYPAHCVLCDAILERKEEGLCAVCRRRVRISRYFFPDGVAPFLYSGVYRDAVRRFKYNGRAEYAAFFSEAVLQAYPGFSAQTAGWRAEQTAGTGVFPLWRDWRPDVLVPVPIHRNRFRERGYNQAEELAREMGRRMQVPCASGLVLRQADTMPQNGLDPLERQNNIRGAFRMRKGKRSPARVLLVDDIRTTGSTLAELKSVLIRHGAQEVYAVCICLAV